MRKLRLELHELRRVIQNVIQEVSHDPFARYVPPERKNPRIGTIYILHFDPPYRHAKHYIGWTKDETAEERIRTHLSGRGSPLVRAALSAGCEITLTATYPGTRDMERYLKNKHGASSICPLCRAAWLAAQNRSSSKDQ